jgi:hypothetical protein
MVVNCIVYRNQWLSALLFIKKQHGCQLYWFLETNMVVSFIVYRTQYGCQLYFIETNMVVSFIVYRNQNDCHLYSFLETYNIWLSASLFIEIKMVFIFIRF